MWSEGICGDGAAILNDGVMTPIEDVVRGLNERDRYRAALHHIADSYAGDLSADECQRIAARALSA